MRVIIDTDPGIDDALAIAFAVLCGELTIDAITTVFGNCPVPMGTRNALHLLQLTGRPDIPVYSGAAGPLVRRRLPEAGAPRVHGETGTGPIILGDGPPGLGAAGSHAATQLVSRVMSAPREVTLLALGPLTNVALAMRLEPLFVEKVSRIVWMGGIVRGHGNVGPFATANVLNDAEAAAIVFAESCGKLTMVGQDVTRHVRVLDDQLDRMGDYGDVGHYLQTLARFYRNAYHEWIEPGVAGFPVHDLLVIVYALRPDLFDTELLPVRVETIGELTTGMTVADFRAEPGYPADVEVCTGARRDQIVDWYETVLRDAAARST